ncbi:MAG: terminase large subunit domain-containing protein [Clostridium sp.]
MITCLDIINKRKELWESTKDIEEDLKFINMVADTLLKEKYKNLREEIQQYPELLIEMVFVIVNKEGESMPFFINESQQKLVDIINTGIADYKAGLRNHLKYILLKGRQAGMTSFITAYQLAKSITTKNFSGITIADNGENTTTIFVDKAKYTFSKIPEPLRPVEQYSTKREMVFDKINSKWRCLNAGAKEIGRSKTINFWHGSEGAFYPDLHNLMKALGQALTKDSIQLIETTANGFNQFKTLWNDAVSGDNNWTPLFFEWWQTSEYFLNFENDTREEEFKELVENGQSEIDKKLRWLKHDKGLSYEQIYWYYGKWKDLKDGVMQEYPCTPEEAFLSSGNPIFDNAKVVKRLDFLKELYKKSVPKRGKFIYEYKNERIINSSIKFIQDPNGWLTIYEDKMEYYPYVIGGDTAEGGTDYCIGQVVNNRTNKQVATFRARMDTDLFAKQMYCLGLYYNTALIGIESNFDLHPIKELERLRYPKQYMRESMDNLGGIVNNKAGFNTNKATKPVIIGNLVEIVREETHLINDVKTCEEMLTFIDNDGKYEAVVGEHDDTVMALAIAYEIRKQQRTKLATVEEDEKELPLPFQSNNDNKKYGYEEFF